MCWNDGYERRKFEARQKKQAEEYRALGMTEAQIKEMYEFDLEQYRYQNDELGNGSVCKECLCTKRRTRRTGS